MASFRYLVNDIDEAIEFYGKLGFEIRKRYGPVFAIMSRDDIELWVSGPETFAAKPMPDGSKPEPGGWNRFVIPVKDIAKTKESLMSDGVQFRSDIVVGTGGKQILAEDPSGNPIELFEASS
jgi:catechol 2,3-dioxygenase-like lactoylglutathione lyase family enzyme